MSTDGARRNAPRPSGSGICWSTAALIDEESSPPWSRFSKAVYLFSGSFGCGPLSPPRMSCVLLLVGMR
jgi:hypothetical protein